MNETRAFSLSGIPFAVLCAIALLFCVAGFVHGALHQVLGILAGSVLLFAFFAFLCKGFFQVQPNQGMVLLLFGRYAGTTRERGTQPVLNTGTLYQ